MRMAVINGDLVENIIELDEGSNFALPGRTLVDAGNAAPGWRIVDGDLVAPEPVAGPTTPQEVSAVQAKTALYNAGLYDQVEAVLGGSEYAMVRIWWSSAQSWRRDHPYIAGMAAELDLTDVEVDALFEAAAGVPT